MTQKEEILAMEAGRELDVLVAKEIFGIEVEWDYALWDVNKQCNKLPFCKGKPRTVLGPMAHSVSNTIPGYSTDISAAWLVVEKLIDIHPQGDFHLEHLEDEWCCGWCYPPSGADLDNWICGKTAPEAICKAALLTRLEVKE